ncbi:hypothetical protein [uncultured Methylobacterium sp.]|uniref:hypothetical protein n=1 Tax=uncultured Methylobacterium sp. TaxID=157278 RepID=UPI0035C9C4A6
MILTFLVHPMVRASADQWVAPAIVVAPDQPALKPLPGMRPVSIVISPTRVASLQSDRGRAASSAVETAQEIDKDLVKPPLKPRRTMREGCEAALSSLVGPEARRMVPGRCIS